MSAQATCAFLDKNYFDELCRRAFAELKEGENLFVRLSAESSQFVRINGARVRQSGLVEDAHLGFTFVLRSQQGELRQASRTITLSGLSYVDQESVRGALHALQKEVPMLPVDPFAQLPKNPGSSHAEKKGALLPVEAAAETLLTPLKGVDLAGIYAAGPVVRAMANSAGLSHWFSTETFSLDYSLYTPGQRALKGTFAGTQWNAAEYARSIEGAVQRLKLMERKSLEIPRGAPRVYLAPAALGNLIAMFSWGTVSEASLRQGDSSLRLVRSGEKKFSPRFSLAEDFRGGEIPRFNEEGELAPEFLPLISEGQLKNTLVSARTAQEYGAASNGAAQSETLRTPVVAPGSLAEVDILKRLDTGLYLSNLHYLNWSDKPGGRVTGMTRYACFWVEKGQIVAPIENMRFDDSIFSLLGGALEELTSQQEYLPEVGTYGLRELGGMRVPGALLSEMKFTI